MYMEEETVDKEKRTKPKQTERETTPDVPTVPIVPIVRGNTPRPFMYTTMPTIPPSQLPDEPVEQSAEGAFLAHSTFPTRPPSAPPLPEEQDDYDEMEERLYTLPTPNKVLAPAHETQTFAWLFEYGLEMDSNLLNTPERLDGLALLYGPVVLKGYTLVLECYEVEDSVRVAARIVPDAHPYAEVYGVLYRVPQHVTEKRGTEPSLLESVHVLPKSTVEALRVVVHETYRDRVLPCITYGYNTARPSVSASHAQDDLAMYVRRLTSIAKKQKLPEAYIEKLAHMSILSTNISAIDNEHTSAVDNEQSIRETAPSLPVVTAVKTEQHTEPLVLPLVEKLEKGSYIAQTPVPLMSQVQRVPIKAHPQRWFVALALYLFFLLLAVLAFAIVQGTGVANDILNEHFTLLSVPWLVLIYGLLGGCISSIITLGRTTQPVEAPVFVLITWFTRPFVGVVLALFAYLLLSSGLFVPASGLTGQHEPLFLLVGALAGLCEGWLFLRKH